MISEPSSKGTVMEQPGPRAAVEAKEHLDDRSRSPDQALLRSPRKKLPVLRIARNRAKDGPNNMNKELRNICLKMENAHWESPKGQAIRDAVSFLMKRFELALRRIESDRFVDTEELVDTVSTLDFAVHCLPGKRLRATRQEVWKLAAAIEEPVPQQDETEEECILRETVEKGGCIPLLFKTENMKPLELAHSFARVKAAANAALEEPSENQGPSIA